MKHNKIDELIFKANEIPSIISGKILELFGVNSVSELPKTKISKLYSEYKDMFFHASKKPNYEDSSRAYTLRYLPVNFYKIWTPLYDLLEKDLLKAKCNILDLGCGPGTISLGLIEFYRFLAIDNPYMSFEMNVKAVEREEKFLNVFETIFIDYKKSLPQNLKVSVCSVNKDIFKYFNDSEKVKFDIITEGNLFNAFEDFGVENIEIYCNKMKERLNSHSSVIMIEPGKRELQKTLNEFRQISVKVGLSIYSPCKCINLCGRFPMAKVDISNISIANELKKLHLSNDTKVHNFEYLVLRNDQISKYDELKNLTPLSELSNHIGEQIKFTAYIIGAFDHGKDGFDLAICDGSFSKTEIYLSVPEKLLSNVPVNMLEVGRGRIVKVKNAIIENYNKITCRTSTMIEII